MPETSIRFYSFRGAGSDESDVLRVSTDRQLRVLPVWKRRRSGEDQRPLHPRPQHHQRQGRKLVHLFNSYLCLRLYLLE